MSMDPESASFDSLPPSEWLLRLRDLDPTAAQQTPLSQVILEPTLLFPFDPYEPLWEAELDAQPADFDERPAVSPVCSSSSVSLPSTFLLQPPAFLPPKWHKIPQVTYALNQWDYTPSEDIVFQVSGFPGVNMRDALYGEFTALESRGDAVMRDTYKTAFQCRFWFSGCPVKSYQISTMDWNRDRNPIPRSKLAHEVAKKLDKYLGSMTNLSIADPSTGRQWQIGAGFVHLGNIFLQKLESVSKGSYQPVFYIVDPSM